MAHRLLEKFRNSLYCRISRMFRLGLIWKVILRIIRIGLWRARLGEMGNWLFVMLMGKSRLCPWLAGCIARLFLFKCIMGSNIRQRICWLILGLFMLITTRKRVYIWQILQNQQQTGQYPMWSTYKQRR